ncbi:MAG: acyl-CoA dehydrogenase family protein [Spirochaetaceae bacterium]|nr:acyl-CoA dehydrogenase family protein [Myxococcales bacterium]MCB9723692.1 acyl-CoA dehydrogenase family protein [Spirochaetaceae bacterium]HPG26245.1 acyl-CoA dehydrogenase [Myxococcota bacterium]
MELVLNEDQELIAKTALDFVAEHSPVSRFRALRDADDRLGYSQALYREMAELGWTGIAFAEEEGGAGMGLAELALVVEALGRKLAPEPFLGGIAMGGTALSLGASPALRSAWLPGVIDGSKVVALAHQEAGARYDLCAVKTRAEAAGDGFRLTGEKTGVLDAVGADAVIVPARTAGQPGDRAGLTLFLVETDRPGVSLERQVRVDHRNAAILRLDGVACGAAAVLGQPGEGADLLEAVIDRATVVLCAEMLGGMSEAFDLTVDYLKTREQFGVPIGSFQALQHRAARVYMEVELARSAVMAAARAVDAAGAGPLDADVRKLVSLAKARCSDAYVLATNEGVQLFGGVGMTDEYDIGFYMKRARAAELTFGDAAFHRDRWAMLGRY